ncbi:hypothetical protein DACRYDRAFT_19383 [Dacryopinax primogenitus]|uniref:Protein CPL1-like domain-containing protein n=1 Tax=Dacryopinax primogenitus (strain DJM 731) TaxID=1858805 RepID=M5GC54_DACPD|nr:uncharacterized protein DACRYDRAFT_19383 [Dacryopinax primogenitus]EJU06065.1 hypothetical protein DACRYDRAFT_19383 [Dacryopinax primogenitus]
MKLPALAVFFFLFAGVFGAAALPRWSPSFPRDEAVKPRWSPLPRDATPLKNRGLWPSHRSLERALDLSKRDLILADSRCPMQHTACGVVSAWTRQGWECIDTQMDLESCGGCVTPLMGEIATGIDCTSLEGVEDVACVSGFCTVYSCRDGFTVAADGQTCVVTAKKPGLHQAASIRF